MLKDELLETKKLASTRLTEEVIKSYDQQIKELKESSLLKMIPKVGDKLPSFSLINTLGETISLDNFKHKGKSLVISFYRGGWCPYCNLELRAYQNVLKEIHDRNAEFIAISPELPDTSLSLTEKKALQFEVLSDIDNTYAKKLGLVFKLNETVKKLYKESGKDFETTQGNDRYELPVPATIVVNPMGEIVYIFADVDYKKRAEPAEVLTYL